MIVGQKTYNDLYAAQTSNILWGHDPGRLMPQLRQRISGGRALDLGFGDGKHALYLEQHGFDVTGYDFCEAALQGLKNRFEQAGQLVLGTYEVRDIEAGIPPGSSTCCFHMEYCNVSIPEDASQSIGGRRVLFAAMDIWRSTV